MNLHIKNEHSLLVQSSLNFGTDLINFVTATSQHADSVVSSPAIVGRPLEEATQVVADVLDRVQVEDAVGAKNCLSSVLQLSYCKVYQNQNHDVTYYLNKI